MQQYYDRSDRGFPSKLNLNYNLQISSIYTPTSAQSRFDHNTVEHGSFLVGTHGNGVSEPILAMGTPFSQFLDFNCTAEAAILSKKQKWTKIVNG